MDLRSLRSIEEIRRMPVMAKAKGKFRDRLLGIVVRVRIGDDVLDTYATSRKLLGLESSSVATNKN